MARRQVLMQLSDELLGEVDALAAASGRNRSDLAREALGDLLAKYRDASIARQYADAYGRQPQRADDGLAAWSDREGARLIAEEPW